MMSIKGKGRGIPQGHDIKNLFKFYGEQDDTVEVINHLYTFEAPNKYFRVTQAKMDHER